MANSNSAKKVHEWIRESFLFTKFNKKFSKREIVLKWGGSFHFNAVSADGEYVVSMSTSRLACENGKKGPGKINAIFKLLYFLLAVKDPLIKRVFVFTEKDMYDYFMEEQKKGQIPSDLQFLLADPLELREELEVSRAIASQEVSP